MDVVDKLGDRGDGGHHRSQLHEQPSALSASPTAGLSSFYSSSVLSDDEGGKQPSSSWEGDSPTEGARRTAAKLETRSELELGDASPPARHAIGPLQSLDDAEPSYGSNTTPVAYHSNNADPEHGGSTPSSRRPGGRGHDRGLGGTAGSANSSVAAPTPEAPTLSPSEPFVVGKYVRPRRPPVLPQGWDHVDIVVSADGTSQVTDATPFTPVFVRCYDQMLQFKFDEVLREAFTRFADGSLPASVTMAAAMIRERP